MAKLNPSFYGNSTTAILTKHKGSSRKRRKKINGYVNGGAMSKRSDVGEDKFEEKNILMMTGSCPHCGAPVFSQHQRTVGEVLKVKFSCNCRKYVKRLLEARYKKYSITSFSSSNELEEATLEEQLLEQEPSSQK